MRFRDYGFRTKLFTLIGIAGLGYLVMALSASLMLSEVRIGGPLYEQIKGMQDLRADILPPPLSLMEPQLLLSQLATSTEQSRLMMLRNRFNECRKEYDGRKAYWNQGSSSSVNSTRPLIAEVMSTADKYYTHVDRSLSSAIMRDMSTAEAQKQFQEALTKELVTLDQLYQENQSAISKLSAETEKQAAANEVVAKETIAWWTRFRSIIVATILGSVIVLGWWIARGIVTPTNALIKRMRDMAEGAGDLTARIPVESQDEIGQLSHWINTVIQRLHDLVAEIKRSSIDLMATATQIAATAKQQESNMHSFGASSTEIAAAVKEISATSQQLTGTMDEVTTGAAHTAELADSGRSGLTNMEAAMHRLAGATSSISTKLATIRAKADDINLVITTITKVADQTNLLSINAAIEAEKAGEYGRGFLVVAREIRRLADQTAVATLDIENIVRHMQSAVTVGVMEMDKFNEEVRSGVEHVGHINSQLGQVIASVLDLRERFEPASEGMRQQSLGASQINEAMGRLTAGAAQTSASLGEFKQATDRLREAVDRLRQGVMLFTVAE